MNISKTIDFLTYDVVLFPITITENSRYMAIKIAGYLFGLLLYIPMFCIVIIPIVILSIIDEFY